MTDTDRRLLEIVARRSADQKFTTAELVASELEIDERAASAQLLDLARAGLVRARVTDAQRFLFLIA